MLMSITNPNHIRDTVPQNDTYFAYLVRPFFIQSLKIILTDNCGILFFSRSTAFLWLPLFYSEMEVVQSSNKRDPNPRINHEETVVNKSTIKLYYNDHDYSKMIQAYIDTVTSNIFLFFNIFNNIFIIFHMY